MAQQIKVKQVKSGIGQPERTKRVLRGLGLRKIGAERTHNDNNCIRGMVNKVRHLVRFEIVSG